MSVPPFGLRMQPDVRDRIEAEAKSNNRSMNAEILARLSLPQQMSLRDWFAGQAISGLIASGFDADQTARCAYVTADAMLAERREAKWSKEP